MTPGATTRTTSSHGVPSIKRLHWWQWLLGALVTVGYVVGMTRVVPSPSFVERITFVNSSPYDVEVDVTNGERAGWLRLGEVEDRATTTIEAVLDQGDTWIVRLARGDGGELRITREQLQRSDWRVRLPPAMEARLQRAWGPPERLVE